MTGAASSPTVLKWYIALELRKLRERGKFSPQQVADHLRCSRPHILSIERSRYLPKAAEVKMMLELYGAPERIESWFDLLEAARTGKDWWLPFKGAVPDWFDLFLGLESSAGQNESYDGFVIKGLFQTPDYAEAVIRAGQPQLGDDEVARQVELRMARQDVLSRQPEPPMIWSVLDESVLHRIAGSPGTMADQLHHLLKVADLPTVNLQIMPMSKGPHAGITGTFTILTFPDLVAAPAVTYTDGMVQGSYYEDPNDVMGYRNALTTLQIDALDRAESRALLTNRAKELSA